MLLKNLTQYYIAVPKATVLRSLKCKLNNPTFIFADINTMNIFLANNVDAHVKLIDATLDKTLPFVIPNKNVYFEFLIPKLHDFGYIENIFLYNENDLIGCDSVPLVLHCENKVQFSSSDVMEKIMLHVKGEEFVNFRAFYWKKQLNFLGNNTRIFDAVEFINPENISIGHNVTIDSGVRIEAGKNNMIYISDNCVLAKGSYVVCSSHDGMSLELGEGSIVGMYSILNAGFGMVIGKNVLIGPNVNINNYNHGYEDKQKLIRNQDAFGKMTFIGNDCWLGTGAIVLGARIGVGCVIGAGSFVNKDIDDFSVAVGNPIKIIKKRN